MLFAVLIPKELCIPASGALNSNGIKTLLPNGLSTIFIKRKPAFINGPKSLPRNALCHIILDK